MHLWHLLCCLLCMGLNNAQEKTFLVTAPKFIRVDAYEKVVIQLFGYNSESTFTISFKNFPSKNMTLATDTVTLNAANNYQNSVMLKILPRHLPKGGIFSNMVYLEARSNEITKEEMIPVTSVNGFLFIQTDKPLYTPEQSVKVRVFSLNEELKPAQRPITVTYMDPEFVKVDIVEVEDVTGIASLPDFKLPLNPKYGVWRIQAAYSKDFSTSVTAEFEVKEYTLPSFIISIEPGSQYICFNEFENFKFTVKARYLHGKPLTSADVFVQFGIINGEKTTMFQMSAQHAVLDEGEAEVIFNTNTALKSTPSLMMDSLEQLDGKFLYILLSVMESTGGISVDSELSNIKYVISPYSLNLVATPLFVKPSLPYYVKVQVKDPVGGSARRIPVKLQASTLDKNGQETLIEDGKSLLTSSSDGTVLFVVNIPSDAATLQLKVETADSKIPVENQARKEFTAVAYKSTINSYLHIDWSSQHKLLHVGDYVSVNVYPKSPYLFKIQHFNYQIISKGKIVSFGSEKRVKDSIFQNLNFQVTSDMVPSARLLVYYIVTGENIAELVADSVWMDVQEECVNNLKVTLSSKNLDYEPKMKMDLTIDSQPHSYVALSSMDKAVHSIRTQSKSSMLKVLDDIEKSSDRGCGGGGGKDASDVFNLVGLSFMTNANSKATDARGDMCSDILRPKRSTDLNKEMNDKANSYTDTRLQKCCLDGARVYPIGESCQSRASRLTNAPNPCKKAFYECCFLANKLRAEERKIHILARGELTAIFGLQEPKIRSYFPESWLWEVHYMQNTGRKTLSFNMPDSLTTWEMSAIAVSKQGICVAKPLNPRVFKDVSINVLIPYSVVRGEQIELRGSVYNYKNENSWYCVTLEVPESVCLSQGTKTKTGVTQETPCNKKSISELSVKAFFFTLLPLEVGTHTLRFSLKSPLGSEVLVKTLKVVPEGIKSELYEGGTLDPQGIYGLPKKRLEFRYRIPSNVVPKSKVERMLSVNGEVLGEIISTVVSPGGLQQLVNLPRGSGESELMALAPLCYVYHYLEKSDQWGLLGPDSFNIRINLRGKMREAITGVLSFRRPKEFSYSIWKNGEPSTWLTALIVKILGQVSVHMSVDYMTVCNSIFWLTGRCQKADGSFEDKSGYVPVKLQNSGANAEEQSLYLTAFTVIGIAKGIQACPLLEYRDPVNKARDYLFTNLGKIKNVYTQAIVTYALALTDKSSIPAITARDALKKNAKVIGNPTIQRYWRDLETNSDTIQPNKGTARMVEMTSHALLTTLLYGDMHYANPIMNWLTEQQRYGGGFYSTQDTIVALEALTEYALLAKRSTLDMIVTALYRKEGKMQEFDLSQEKSLAKPVEVTKNDDLVITTGNSRGVSVVNIRTMYYQMNDAQSSCFFDLKIGISINRHAEARRRRRDLDDISIGITPSYTLEACAKYKPHKNEIFTESSHTVMEISLLTGMEPVEEDLETLATGLDQLISDYTVNDNRVIVQVESIPSDRHLCVGFRLREIFKSSLRSSAQFKVYEYHEPDRQCSMLYKYTGDQSLTRVCQGEECKCMEAGCGHLKPEADVSITLADRKKAACQANTEYVYKVEIISSMEEGDFKTYRARIEDIFKKGTDRVEKDSVVTLTRNAKCIGMDIQPKEFYLVMGSEAIVSKDFTSYQYAYPLGPKSWVELWPSRRSCSSQNCMKVLEVLNEFSEDLLINGCQM
ncbi:complement C5 [Polypterus senegalus]|uniref:complement C5 n=1 Tax=Polypterus senegalus TaxID=55291 RepID=UPI001964D914|nr:complement C5 [Polypterus senegalus]